MHLGRAAKEKKAGIAFFLDEIQFVKQHEFRALISALHRAMQKLLPVTLAARGCPRSRGSPGRPAHTPSGCFAFHTSARSDELAARAALVLPAEREGATYTRRQLSARSSLRRAIPSTYRNTANTSRNLAPGSPITERDVEAAAPRAEESLDRGIYEVRIQRATIKERRYLRAMAELGVETSKVGAVAKAMGSTTTGLSTVRQKLLDRGLIYATEDYGYVDFTVPALR